MQSQCKSPKDGFGESGQSDSKMNLDKQRGKKSQEKKKVRKVIG